jgi:O-antigen/teichoic acid export membrane protein
LVQIVAARGLGPEGYGIFGFVVSVGSLFLFLADPNLQVLVAREVARDPDSARTWIGRSLALWLAMSAVLVGCAGAYAALLDGRPYVVAAAAVSGLATALFAGQALLEASLQGLRSLRPLMGSSLAARSLYLVFAVLAIAAGFGLHGVLWAQVLGTAVGFAWLFLWLYRHLGAFPLPGVSEVVRLAKDTVPFALSRLFGTIYLGADVLLMQVFLSDADLGAYRLAGLLLVQLGAVSVMLNRLYLPWFSTSDPEALSAKVSFTWRVAVAVSAPLAIGGMVLAAPILGLLGGDGYQIAAPLMAVLMMVLPLRFLNNLLSNLLSARDRQTERTWATAVGAFGTIACNLALLPWIGATGAAWSALVVDGVVLVWQVWVARDLLRGTGLILVTSRALAPALVMGLAIGWASRFPLWMVIPGGAMVFFVLAVVTRGVRRDDLRTLTGL